MFGADWNIGLSFLKVLLSWPPLAAAIATYFLFTYRAEVGDFLRRLRSFNFGPLAGQSDRIASAPEAASPPKEAPPPNVATQLSPDDTKRLEEWFASEKAAARIWEYRYLNLFFAPTTQIVLDWLVGLNTETTLSAYEATFGSNFPGHERLAILNALELHVLIRTPGGVIQVTDKGREYALWQERRRRQPANV